MKFLGFSVFFLSLTGYSFSQEIYPAILEPLHQTHLYAENQSSIYYEVYTYAIDIPKNLGDSFQKGDVLVRFENRVSRANVIKTQSDLDRARTDLNVKKALYADHLISELELKESQANVSGAEFQLILSQKNYEASVVRAPFDGRVADVYIRLYEIPERGRPIMDIINDSLLIAKFLVPSEAVISKNIGDSVYILIKDTGEIITTTIKRISPIINPASGTIRVEAEIDNRSGHLKGGMTSMAAFSEQALRRQESSVQDILKELQNEKNP